MIQCEMCCEYMTADKTLYSVTYKSDIHVMTQLCEKCFFSIFSNIDIWNNNNDNSLSVCSQCNKYAIYPDVKFLFEYDKGIHNGYNTICLDCMLKVGGQEFVNSLKEKTLFHNFGQYIPNIAERRRIISSRMTAGNISTQYVEPGVYINYFDLSSFPDKVVQDPNTPPGVVWHIDKYKPYKY